MKSKGNRKPMSAPLKRFLNGSRLPFAPTRSQTPTTAEVELIPQVKADRKFMQGEPVGEPELLSAVAKPSPADIHEAKVWRDVLGAAPAEGPKVTTLDELSPWEQEHLLRTARVESKE